MSLVGAIPALLKKNTVNISLFSIVLFVLPVTVCDAIKGEIKIPDGGKKKMRTPKLKHNIAKNCLADSSQLLF
jgi:hypothetical protein